MRHRIFAIMLAGLMIAATARAQERPATRPATQPADDLEQEILHLLGDLESPQAAVREKATQRLVEIGPRCLRPLREALTLSPGPEFRSRAEEILREIPRKWRYVKADGGDVEAGFQATLRAAQDTFPAGSPIKLLAEICNCAPRTAQLSDVRGIDFELPDEKLAFTSPHCDARLIVRRLPDSPAKLPKEGHAVIYSREAGQPIDFLHGGRIQTSINIDDGVELAPGRYEVQFVYYARSKSLLKGASADLKSNTVRIAVK
jgi:hypothetical protein